MNFEDQLNADVAVIIPARIESERLHQKPLQMIGSKSMIAHVVSAMQKLGIQHTYVATNSELIRQEVANYDGQCIMVQDFCKTGTDRVYKAFLQIPDRANIQYIVNVQGDMPFIKPNLVLDLIQHLKASNYDIMTPVAKVNEDFANGISNVKVVVDKLRKALYFSRNMIPWGSQDFLYHIGVYGFRKEKLEKFVSLGSSELEDAEGLEQLRALENGMSIGVCYSADVPISVDTMDDLNKAKEFVNN